MRGCEQPEAVIGSSLNSRAVLKSVCILSPQQSSQLLNRGNAKAMQGRRCWTHPNRAVSHAAEGCSVRLMGKVLRCPWPCCLFGDGDGTWVPPALLPQEQFSSSTKQEACSPWPHLPSPPGYKAGFDLCKLRTRQPATGSCCHLVAYTTESAGTIISPRAAREPPSPALLPQGCTLAHRPQSQPCPVTPCSAHPLFRHHQCCLQEVGLFLFVCQKPKLYFLG